MSPHICRTCGVQYAAAAEPPPRCIICEDARQFVPRAGQEWTTPARLGFDHFTAFRTVAPGLLGLCTMPAFAIGQRAFLLRTSAGNVLWDCLSFLDAATVEIVRALGGLAAVAVSHPHFHSAMATWGRTFGCPVRVHESHRDWIVDPDPCVELWSGETHELLSGVTLHRLGGHFPGSAALLWAERRALFTGDTVLVTPDRCHVAFMWSYPNYVPLPAAEVQRLASRLDGLDFDSLHSAFWDRGDIEHDARAAVRCSAARHLEGPGRI